MKRKHLEMVSIYNWVMQIFPNFLANNHGFFNKIQLKRNVPVPNMDIHSSQTCTVDCRVRFCYESALEPIAVAFVCHPACHAFSTLLRFYNAKTIDKKVFCHSNQNKKKEVFCTLLLNCLFCHFMTINSRRILRHQKCSGLCNDILAIL